MKFINPSTKITKWSDHKTKFSLSLPLKGYSLLPELEKNPKFLVEEKTEKVSAELNFYYHLLPGFTLGGPEKDEIRALSCIVVLCT